MKGLPEIIKVVDILFPAGNYWYYPAYIIMWVGLSLFGLYTSIFVVFLDQGQTELSTAVISLLFNWYGYLMAVFVFYIAVAGLIDFIDLFQDDEL